MLHRKCSIISCSSSLSYKWNDVQEVVIGGGGGVDRGRLSAGAEVFNPFWRTKS